MKRLEDLGLLMRIPSHRGGTNKYDLSKFITALETLMAADVAAADAAAIQEAGA